MPVDWDNLEIVRGSFMIAQDRFKIVQDIFKIVQGSFKIDQGIHWAVSGSLTKREHVEIAQGISEWGKLLLNYK